MPGFVSVKFFEKIPRMYHAENDSFSYNEIGSLPGVQGAPRNACIHYSAGTPAFYDS